MAVPSGKMRIRWDRAAIRALKTDPDVTEMVDDVSRKMAERMRSSAPKNSGGGAQSISAHHSRAVGADDIGWDANHWYLIFPEYGTKFQAQQRFARDVLDAYTFF